MKREFIRACVVVAALLLPLHAVAQEQTKELDKKNLVVKEWNTDARSNTRVLDHVTTYNSAGKKIEEIEYDSSGQKWRKRYEYDDNGKQITEMVYDARNRLDNYKKFEYNEFGKKKTQYTYDPKGKVSSIKVYEYITQNAGE